MFFYEEACIRAFLEEENVKQEGNEPVRKEIDEAQDIATRTHGEKEEEKKEDAERNGIAVDAASPQNQYRMASIQPIIWSLLAQWNAPEIVKSLDASGI